MLAFLQALWRRPIPVAPETAAPEPEPIPVDPALVREATGLCRFGPSWLVDAPSDPAVAEIVSRYGVVSEGVGRLVFDEAFAAMRREVEAVAGDLVPEDVAAGEAALPESVRPQLLKLYPHQLVATRFLLRRRSALLADACGVGKTCPTIVAAEAIRKGPVLVLCPASLTQNWIDELAVWAPGQPAVVALSDTKLPKTGWVVASYDTAKRPGRLRSAMLRRQWQIAVFDEAHRAKNPRSGRGALCGRLKIERRWLLTGTPYLNRPEDVRGLLALGGHPLADAPDFKSRFVQPKNQEFGAEELGREIAPWVLHRTKEQVLTLPGKERVVHECSIEPFEVDKPGIMRAKKRLALAKVEATTDLVRSLLEAGDAVVVFSGYPDVLHQIQTRLNGCAETDVIDGSVPAKKRQKIAKAFCAGLGPAVVLGQIVAAGEGLTMTRAPHVVTNDYSFVPAEHSQAEDRAYRIGQKRKVTAHYVVSDHPVDAALSRIVQRKIAESGAFEAGIGSGPDRITVDDLFAEMASVLHGAKASWENWLTRAADLDGIGAAAATAMAMKG